MHETAAFGCQSIDDFPVPHPVGHEQDQTNDRGQADDRKEFDDPGRGLEGFRQEYGGIGESGQGQGTEQDQAADFAPEGPFSLLSFLEAIGEIAIDLSIAKADQGLQELSLLLAFSHKFAYAFQIDAARYVPKPRRRCPGMGQILRS